MANYIVQEDGLFFTFSSVSDMVSSPVLPRAEFEAWYAYQAAKAAREEIAPRIARAIQQGSSSHDGENAYDIVRGNAERISLKKILARRETLEGMEFGTALGLARAGLRIRRKGWDRTWSIEDGKLTVRWPDPAGGEDAVAPAYELHEDDILADDWEVA